MTALVRCQNCGWSHRYDWPRAARRAALRHRCESGSSKSESSQVTGAHPEPDGNLAPEHEDPPGSGSPTPPRLTAKTRESLPVTAPTSATPTTAVSPTRMVGGWERMVRDQQPPAANQPSGDPTPRVLLPAPFYTDNRVTLYTGDAVEVLAGLPDDVVDCVVTSPPYWGL